MPPTRRRPPLLTQTRQQPGFVAAVQSLSLALAAQFIQAFQQTTGVQSPPHAVAVQIQLGAEARRPVGVGAESERAVVPQRLIQLLHAQQAGMLLQPLQQQGDLGRLQPVAGGQTQQHQPAVAKPRRRHAPHRLPPLPALGQRVGVQTVAIPPEALVQRRVAARVQRQQIVAARQRQLQSLQPRTRTGKTAGFLRAECLSQQLALLMPLPQQLAGRLQCGARLRGAGQFLPRRRALQPGNQRGQRRPQRLQELQAFRRRQGRSPPLLQPLAGLVRGEGGRLRRQRLPLRLDRLEVQCQPGAFRQGVNQRQFHHDQVIAREKPPMIRPAMIFGAALLPAQKKCPAHGGAFRSERSQA